MIQNKNIPTRTIGVPSKQKTDGFTHVTKLTATILSVLMLTSMSPAGGTQKVYKTYQGQISHLDLLKTDFSVRYVSDWKVDKSVISKTKKGAAVIGFMCPSDNPDDFRSRVILQREELRPRPQLRKFLKAQGIKLPTIPKGHKEIERGSVVVAGRGADYAIYSGYDEWEDKNLKYKAWSFIIDETETIYTLTYIAESKNFDIYFLDAEDLVNSFQLSLAPPMEPEPLQQGRFISCEECVHLYPEKYKDNPKSCPVCGGQKEHFQPARFMDEQLTKIEARELELKIEELLLKTIINAKEKPVSIETIKKIRDRYERKLIFHLVHGKFEPEPIIAHIRMLDNLIVKIKNQK